jgi:hypothetical protein
MAHLSVEPEMILLISTILSGKPMTERSDLGQALREL